MESGRPFVILFLGLVILVCLAAFCGATSMYKVGTGQQLWITRTPTTAPVIINNVQLNDVLKHDETMVKIMHEGDSPNGLKTGEVFIYGLMMIALIVSILFLASIFGGRR